MIVGFLAIFYGSIAVVVLIAITAAEWAAIGMVVAGLALMLSPLLRPHTVRDTARGGGRSGESSPGEEPPRVVRAGSHWFPEVEWKWPER